MKVYGPYTRKDGRKHVILYENGIRTTISYPKFLMEQFLGRQLENWETVDHINNDFTDDRIENLQILSREDNAKKAMEVEEKKMKIGTYVCPECFISFNRPIYRIRQNQINHKKVGPFCTKICSGKYGAKIRQIYKESLININ